jgi:hypothetical protein
MKIYDVGYIQTKFHMPVLNGSLVMAMKLQIQYEYTVVITLRGAILFCKNVYVTTMTWEQSVWSYNLHVLMRLYFVYMSYTVR